MNGYQGEPAVGSPSSTSRAKPIVVRPEGITNFSTVGLPPEERIVLWQEHLSHELVDVNCRSLKPTEFTGATINLQLAHTHLAHIETATAAVIERRPQMIRQRPAEAIFLQFVLGGEAFIFDDDGVRTLR